MKEYRIKVIAEQKKEGVEALADGRLAVSVNAKREEGKANDRARELLSEFLHTHTDKIIIVSGHTRSTKTIRIRE